MTSSATSSLLWPTVHRPLLCTRTLSICHLFNPANFLVVIAASPSLSFLTGKMGDNKGSNKGTFHKVGVKIKLEKNNNNGKRLFSTYVLPDPGWEIRMRPGPEGRVWPLPAGSAMLPCQ